MSDSPKKNPKRLRADSSEETSFVENITLRISSLLPTSLTRWFNSASGSDDQNHSNGSVHTLTDNAPNAHDEIQSLPLQPPPKRIKLSSQTNDFDYTPTPSTSHFDVTTPEGSRRHKYVSDLLESDPPESSEEKHSTEGTLYKRNYIQSQLSESSPEESERPIVTICKRRPIRSAGRSLYSTNASADEPCKPCDSSMMFTSTPESKSASSEPSRQSTRKVDAIKRPSFKACLLGSPFYSGKTSYGGATSSYVNSPNIIQQKLTVVNDTSRNDNTTSHATQRVSDLLGRITSPMPEVRHIPALPEQNRENFLNRLRNMSTMTESRNSLYRTQEFHAPSVASVLRLKKRSRLMDTTNMARQIMASHSSSINMKIPSNKGFDQEKPSPKFTTKIKTTLTRQRRGGDVEETVPERTSLPEATLLIDESKLVNISFGISVVPVSSATVSSETCSVNNTTPIKTNLTSTFTKSPTTNITIDNAVKFSSPITVSKSIPFNESTSPVGFTFNSPERGAEKLNKNNSDIQKTKAKDATKTSVKNWQCGDCWVNNKDDADKCCCCGGKKPAQKTSDTVDASEIKPAKQKDWQCADCWVSNKDEADKCVCCGGKKPSKEAKLDKCTDCKSNDRQTGSQLCTICQKVKLNNSLPLPKPDNAGKWQCSNCWVSNDVTSNICISCCATNPKEKIASSNAKEKTPPSTNHTTDKWKCNDCWVRDNANDSKCETCGVSNPISKSTPVTKPKSNKANVEQKLSIEPSNLFKNAISAQSGKWECSNCLVGNDSNNMKCVCCEHVKPGTEKETGNGAANFAFKMTNQTFKFGIDPQMQTQEKAAESKPVTESSICEEQSETNNNIVTKAPTFSFGVPENIPAKEAKDKADSKSSFNFSFGIPSVTKVPTFELKKDTETTVTEAEQKERPQEVPKVDLLAPKPQEQTKAQEPPKISPSLFALPTATQPSNEIKNSATSPPASVFGLAFGQENKTDKPTPPITFGIPATAVNLEPKGFTFTKTISKPATTVIEPVSTNTLSAPNSILAPTFVPPPAASTMAPAIAPTVISTTASFTLPAPTTFTFQNSVSATPTLPFFQKPDSNPPATGLFQQKTDPVQATIAASAPASTAPFYSFGSTTAAPNANTEKPKFNFLFGKTSGSDSTTMFKFGATNDSAPSANSFQLPTGNGIANTINAMPFGGALLGNSFTGGNGMAGNTTLPTTNSLESGGGLGGLFNTVKDTNMWASNNNSASGGLFGSANNTQPKEVPFSFGAAPFGNPQTQSMFGSPAVNASGGSLFGPSASAPAAQPTPFGSSPAPATNMFGTASPFGAPNTSMQTFDNPSITPAPAPAFNFGASVTPNTGMFGFGQGGGAAQAPSVYAFGGGAPGGGVPGLQFNMGSAPAAPAARRMRKAARRIPR